VQFEIIPGGDLACNFNQRLVETFAISGSEGVY
jgi:hypothetical protein